MGVGVGPVSCGTKVCEIAPVVELYMNSHWRVWSAPLAPGRIVVKLPPTATSGP